MGNWNISIHGVGAHHNNKEGDADQLARKFVKELKKNGHSISFAAITSSGAEYLTNIPVNDKD